MIAFINKSLHLDSGCAFVVDCVGERKRLLGKLLRHGLRWSLFPFDSFLNHWSWCYKDSDKTDLECCINVELAD